MKGDTQRIEDEWTAICMRTTRLRDEAAALIAARVGHREVRLAEPIEDVDIRGYEYNLVGFGYEETEDTLQEAEGVYIIFEDGSKDFIGHYLIEDQLEICLAILRRMDAMGDEMETEK